MVAAVSISKNLEGQTAVSVPAEPQSLVGKLDFPYYIWQCSQAGRITPHPSCTLAE